ncbi:Fe-Mn family superoxide dismutase, partial [Stenotrophomonas maltophilia]
MAGNPPGVQRCRGCRQAAGTTGNQIAGTPLLCCDVWEHAYYTDY